MADKTVKFGDTWLEDIAPDIRIDDISVSAIVLNPIANDRPIQFGRQFVRNVGSSRTVTITFAIQLDDRDAREEELQAIRDWAKTDKEYTLVLPHFTGRYLEAVCTEQPDSSYRKWWQNNLRLTFTCFNNPFWTSDSITEIPCGTEFSVGGSAPPLMTIENRYIAPGTNKAYSKGSQVMRFSRIPAGNMVIDLNNQTAAVGGVSIMQYFNPLDSFIEPATGARQVINGTGTVKVRERWI